MCSALAKVCFISFVRARVNWFPPMVMLRTQSFLPLVARREVLSAPMSRMIVNSSSSMGSVEPGVAPMRS